MKSPRDHLEINLSEIFIFRRGDFDNYYSSRFYPEDGYSKLARRLRSRKYHKAAIL
jgi:hypothetical protein